MERQEIARALEECNWVMARAARMLGITERMIGYKVKKYGIRKEGDRRTEADQFTETSQEDSTKYFKKIKQT